MKADELKNVTEKKKAEHKKFLQQLKRKPPRNLDDDFHEAHDEVFEAAKHRDLLMTRGVGREPP